MLISSTGAVAAMFWVDADLGSDVYLDGRKYETTMCHLFVDEALLLLFVFLYTCSFLDVICFLYSLCLCHIFHLVKHW